MKYLAAGIFLLLFACKKHETVKPETGRVYVANEGAGTISVVSVPDFRVTKTIDLNPGSFMLMPHNVQVAPDGKTIWVTAIPMSHNDSEQVIVLNAENGDIIKRICFPAHVHLAHIVLDSSSQFAYAAATQTNVIYEIDAVAFKVIKKHDLPGGYAPHGIRWQSHKLYIANSEAQRMSVLDTRNGTIEETDTDDALTQTAVAPGKSFVFASCYKTKSVVRYNMLTRSLLRIPLPAGAQGPIQLYPAPDGEQLYVCDQGLLSGRPSSNKVFVIDIDEGKVINTITAGNGAHGVVVSNDGKYAFVTNSRDHSVSVIETQSRKVVAMINVGLSPNGISFGWDSGGMP